MSVPVPACSPDAIVYEPECNPTEGVEGHSRTPLDTAYFQAAREFQTLAEQTDNVALKARYVRLAQSFRTLAIAVSPPQRPATEAQEHSSGAAA
jgi:hypothetical protein